MKMDLGVKFLGVLALVAAAIVPVQAANIVANGSFETGNFTGWNQTGNTTFNGVECPGAGSVPNGNCDAFFGPIGSVGGISQTLATVAGTAYVISFSLHTFGDNPSSFSAAFGATTLTSLSNPANGPYHTLSFTQAATSASTILAFNFQDNPGFMFLDDVSVQTAPEPTTAALLGLSLGGLALLRRRRA